MSPAVFPQPALTSPPQAAGDRARETRREVRAGLTLMTVLPRSSRWAYGAPGTTGIDVVALNAQLVHDHERLLRAAVDRVPAHVGVRYLLARGPVAAAIARQARAGCHDLVVVGSRAHGPLRALLLGSVNRRLRGVGIPVLSVHARDTEPAAAIDVAPTRAALAA